MNSNDINLILYNNDYIKTYYDYENTHYIFTKDYNNFTIKFDIKYNLLQVFIYQKNEENNIYFKSMIYEYTNKIKVQKYIKDIEKLASYLYTMGENVFIIGA